MSALYCIGDKSRLKRFGDSGIHDIMSAEHTLACISTQLPKEPLFLVITLRHGTSIYWSDLLVLHLGLCRCSLTAHPQSGSS